MKEVELVENWGGTCAKVKINSNYKQWEKGECFAWHCKNPIFFFIVTSHGYARSGYCLHERLESLKKRLMRTGQKVCHIEKGKVVVDIERMAGGKFRERGNYRVEEKVILRNWLPSIGFRITNGERADWRELECKFCGRDYSKCYFCDEPIEFGDDFCCHINGKRHSHKECLERVVDELKKDGEQSG